MDKVAAVQMGNEFDAGRQDAVVQLGDLRMQRVERCVGLRAFAQQNDTRDHVVIIEDHSIVGANCFSELSQADLGCLYDRSHVAHPDRRSVDDLDHRSADIVGGCH
jgi:hypothetical protein